MQTITPTQMVLSAEVASQVTAWLAAGNTIECVPVGATGRPRYCWNLGTDEDPLLVDATEPRSINGQIAVTGGIYRAKQLASEAGKRAYKAAKQASKGNIQTLRSAYRAAYNVAYRGTMKAYSNG